MQHAHWIDILTALALGYMLGAGRPFSGVAVVGVYAGGVLALRWWRGRQGLDQWPHPYGRYYREWMALKTTRLNYYDWLAARKGQADPWATWARWDREIDDRYVRSRETVV